MKAKCTDASSQLASRKHSCCRRAAVSLLLGAILCGFLLSFIKLSRVFKDYESFDLFHLQGHAVPCFTCQVCVVLETTPNSLAVSVLSQAERVPIFMKHPQKSHSVF